MCVIGLHKCLDECVHLIDPTILKAFRYQDMHSYMGQLIHIQRGVKSNDSSMLCDSVSHVWQHVVQWNEAPRCSGGSLQYSVTPA